MSTIEDAEDMQGEVLPATVKILEAQDILSTARHYIECVFLAAASLQREEGGPIAAVLDMASEKIKEADAILDEYRNANKACLLSAELPAKKILYAKPRARAA